MRPTNQRGRNDAPKDGCRNDDVDRSLHVGRCTRRRGPACGEPSRRVRSGAAHRSRRRTARRSVRRTAGRPVRWPTEAGSDSTDSSTRRSAREPVRERQPQSRSAERMSARRWRPVRRPVREVTSTGLATHGTILRAKAADPRLAAFAIAFGSVVGAGCLDGGYYARSWPWIGLALAAAAALRVTLGDDYPDRRGLVSLAGLSALA